jgi:hypothetical protein
VRTPHAVGIAIVVLILVAALLAPHLRSGAAKVTEQAQTEAILARRLLHRHDFRLPILGQRVEAGALKEANLQLLLERARERLAQAAREASTQLNQLRSQAEQARLPVPQIQPPGADAASVRRALSEYEKLLNENQNLLSEAARLARQARTAAGTGAVGIAQVEGMIRYTQAAALLAEADLLRARHQELQARILRQRGWIDVYLAGTRQYAGLNPEPVLERLRADLDEIRQEAEQASQQSESAARELADRMAALAQVGSQLNTAQNELAELERRGFRAGDDAAFEEYRRRYLELSERVRQLQDQEQLLRFGGLEDAELEGDDLLTGVLRGGKVVRSVEELRQTAELAAERARRLAAGVAELQGHIEFLTGSTQRWQQVAEHYADLSDQTAQALDQTWPELYRLVQEAVAKEDAALKAAREALAAFRAEQQAVEQFLRDAREVQSRVDPERKNPRLNLIVGEKALSQAADSARALTLLLVARIHMQRIRANQSLLADLSLLESADESTGLKSLPPDSPIRPEVLEQEIASAREEASKNIQEAIKIYEGLAGKVAPSTKWVPQVALAGALWVAAQLNPEAAMDYLTSAVKELEAATSGREQNPYVGPHAAFRDHLKQLLSALKPVEEPAQGGGSAPQP